uniref:SCP2 domain-containing protein n=1 Tax=Heterorhabditis bacteriophora TaxID=37862 RepID=A0A1I7W7D1_HETBA
MYLFINSLTFFYILPLLKLFVKVIKRLRSVLIQVYWWLLKPDQAFMQGKMKLKGNIAKAMKLKNILDPKMLKAKI